LLDSTISEDLTIQNPEQISSENQSNKVEKNKKIGRKRQRVWIPILIPFHHSRGKLKIQYSTVKKK
jgi:hypothetical protein